MGFSRQEYWSGLPFLLQGIFLTQGLNLGLLHCRQIHYCLNHQESPKKRRPTPFPIIWANSWWQLSLIQIRSHSQAPKQSLRFWLTISGSKGRNQPPLAKWTMSWRWKVSLQDKEAGKRRWQMDAEQTKTAAVHSISHSNIFKWPLMALGKSPAKHILPCLCDSLSFARSLLFQYLGLFAQEMKPLSTPSTSPAVHSQNPLLSLPKSQSSAGWKRWNTTRSLKSFQGLLRTLNIQRHNSDFLWPHHSSTYESEEVGNGDPKQILHHIFLSVLQIKSYILEIPWWSNG